MDWLIKEYSESRANAEHFFAELYTEYDSNKDNCLVRVCVCAFEFVRVCF